MNDRLSDVRLREASASLTDEPRPSAPCPSSDAVWDAARGDASVDQLRQIALHTVDCGACAESWRLACEVRREAGVECVRTRRRPSPIWLAAAAFVALLVVAAGLWQLRPAPVAGPAALRAPEIGLSVSSVSREDEPIPRDAFRLQWTGPDAAHYDVRVTTTDLRPLFDAEDIVTTELIIPAEALADVADGARVIWVVTGRLPDGRTVERAFFAEIGSSP